MNIENTIKQLWDDFLINNEHKYIMSNCIKDYINTHFEHQHEILEYTFERMGYGSKLFHLILEYNCDVNVTYDINKNNLMFNDAMKLKKKKK